MATFAHRPWEQHNPEPDRTYYTSNALRLFAERLERLSEGQVLDVGPVCCENIRFFANRVKRLHVCDMFLRLDRKRRNSLPLSQAWRHLDYPPQSFDGILLWELVDRLDDREVKRLADLCYTMVKPKGTVLVFVLGEQSAPPTVNSFVIGAGYQIYQRLQPHLDLPLHRRQNREVLSLMEPLRPIKSFTYLHGFREFLFQRN